MNALEVAITNHARDVMDRRAIPWSEVASAIEEPVVTEPHRHGNVVGRRFVSRTGVVAVIAGDNDDPVLVTVLLRDRETWTDEDARDRFGGGS